jgi:hypothetical protein
VAVAPAPEFRQILDRAIDEPELAEQTCQFLAVPPRELACEMPFLLSVAGRDHDIALARMGDAFLPTAPVVGLSGTPRSRSLDAPVRYGAKPRKDTGP